MTIRNETWDADGTLIRRESIDLDAGTYTLEEYGVVTVAPRPLTADEIERWTPVPEPVPVEETVAKIESTVVPMLAAARLSTAKAILAEELEPEQVGEVAAIYPEWSAGEAVKIGDFRRYADELYSCIQAHTTQSDWTPDIVPALWRHWPKVAAGELYPAWNQPLGAHDSYRIGDRVTHNGKNWECTAADANGNNSWEPGVYGWTEI